MGIGRLLQSLDLDLGTLEASLIRMVNKHCAYGTCNSDSRHMHKPHMEGVGLLYFPQSKKNPDKCSRWVKLCGRPSEGYRSFAEASVTKDTYICTRTSFRMLAEGQLTWTELSWDAGRTGWRDGVMSEWGDVRRLG